MAALSKHRTGFPGCPCDKERSHLTLRKLILPEDDKQTKLQVYVTGMEWTITIGLGSPKGKTRNVHKVHVS